MYCKYMQLTHNITVEPTKCGLLQDMQMWLLQSRGTLIHLGIYGTICSIMRCTNTNPNLNVTFDLQRCHASHYAIAPYCMIWDTIKVLTQLESLWL